MGHLGDNLFVLLHFFGLLNYSKHQLDGVSAADCILSGVQIFGEVLKRVTNDVLDTLFVHDFNRLVNGFTRLLLHKVESFSPVAEVTRYAKHSLIVHKIWQKSLRISMVIALGNVADHKRHEFHLISYRRRVALETLDHKGQMHFQTVLILFILGVYAHHTHLFLTILIFSRLVYISNKLVNCGVINCHVSQRTSPLLTHCRRNIGKVNLVRWPNQNNPLIGLVLVRCQQISIRISGCRSAISETCMWANNDFETARIWNGQVNNLLTQVEVVVHFRIKGGCV